MQTLNTYELDAVRSYELATKWATLMAEGRRNDAAKVARELRDHARDLVAISRERY